MSLATFRGVDAEGAPLPIKPPRYKHGRLVWQSARPHRADRYIAHSDDTWKSKALAYVRWLAARDGIELPKPAFEYANKIRVDWGGVYKPRKTGCPVYERRIRAVEWGHEVRVYNTRKDGRQGAYLYTNFIVDFEFPLPNWDWQPEMTETRDYEPQALAA